MARRQPAPDSDRGRFHFIGQPGVEDAFTPDPRGLFPFISFSLYGDNNVRLGPEAGRFTNQQLGVIALSAFGMSYGQIADTFMTAGHRSSNQMIGTQMDRIRITLESPKISAAGVFPQAVAAGVMSVTRFAPPELLLNARRQHYNTSTKELLVLLARGLEFGEIAGGDGSNENAINARVVELGDRTGIRGVRALAAAAVVTGLYRPERILLGQMA